MRFLIDNALSPLLAAEIKAAGHEATHVRELGMQQADDEAIMGLAASEDRVVVSADTDFGTLAAFHQTRLPSIILFRRGSPRRPEAQAGSFSRISRAVRPTYAGERSSPFRRVGYAFELCR